MKTLNRLRTLSSLVILALGFSLLGFIFLINKWSEYNGSIFSAEHAYSCIESTFSILVGATFRVAVITFGAGVRPSSERLVTRFDASLI
jgi:hypothetical protein